MIKGQTGLIGRALDCEKGVAALEFAVLTPFLLALTIATIDLGVGFYRKMQVQNAADAGATYASFNGFKSAGVTNAITTATTFPVAATPSPSQFCGCPNVSGVTVTPCASQCPGNLTPGTYVSSSAQAAYAPIFHYPTIPTPLVLQATALVRLR